MPWLREIVASEAKLRVALFLVYDPLDCEVPSSRVGGRVLGIFGRRSEHEGTAL